MAKDINKRDLMTMVRSAPDDATFTGWDDGEIYAKFNGAQWHIEKESLRWVRYKTADNPIYASLRGRNNDKGEDMASIDKAQKLYKEFLKTKEGKEYKGDFIDFIIENGL